jgi:hypothetical protein
MGPPGPPAQARAKGGSKVPLIIGTLVVVAGGIVALVLALGGHKTDQTDKDIEILTSFRDDICGCKTDSKCAHDKSDGFSNYLDIMHEAGNKPSTEQKRAISALILSVSSCQELQNIALARDTICACKDASCADKAFSELQEEVKIAEEMHTPTTKEQDADASKMIKELGSCRRRLAGP